MTNTATETLSVVVEREVPFPPEKIWRALTQPHLIEEWLMKNDFKPVVDHRFNLRADWRSHGEYLLSSKAKDWRTMPPRSSFIASPSPASFFSQ
jgi:uncharacterized protein YndB with AHSA1/START domain